MKYTVQIDKLPVTATAAAAAAAAAITVNWFHTSVYINIYLWCTVWSIFCQMVALKMSKQKVGTFCPPPSKQPSKKPILNRVKALQL